MTSRTIVLYSSERKAWKIGDFGLTVRGTSKNQISTTKGKGTPCYRAPEILKDDSKYNNKVDIWAIGCIVYELITEQQAFRSDHDAWEWRFSTDQEKKLPEEIVLDDAPKQLLSKIIGKCLRIEPNERPTVKVINSWLREYLGLPSNESIISSDPSFSRLDRVPSSPGI